MVHVDYSIAHKDFLYLPRSSVCDDPGKQNLITNCVMNRLMSIIFSFQSKNFIKLSFLPVTLKVY